MDWLKNIYALIWYEDGGLFNDYMINGRLSALSKTDNRWKYDSDTLAFYPKFFDKQIHTISYTEGLGLSILSHDKDIVYPGDPIPISTMLLLAENEPTTSIFTLGEEREVEKCIYFFILVIIPRKLYRTTEKKLIRAEFAFKGIYDNEMKCFLGSFNDKDILSSNMIFENFKAFHSDDSLKGVHIFPNGEIIFQDFMD